MLDFIRTRRSPKQ